MRALPFVILALLLAACGGSPDDDRLSLLDLGRAADRVCPALERAARSFRPL